MKATSALLLAAFVILGGCATPLSRNQVSSLDFGALPLEYEAIIKEYFDGRLFDPYSAHYDFKRPVEYYVKDAPLMGGRVSAGYLVRVEVNAKNRFGGYVGKKAYGFIIKNDRIIKVMDELDLQNIRTR